MFPKFDNGMLILQIICEAHLGNFALHDSSNLQHPPFKLGN